MDGVILINQNRALAGNVTPGDGAGFPVSITRPGSYRLSGNLTVPNENTNAIEISANDVTIDLNGFAILGATVCSGIPVTSCAPLGSGRGIGTIGTPGNIAVRNGTVAGMGNRGISLTGSGHLVEKVRAQGNGGDGIQVASGVVSQNTATRNGARGIQLGFNGIVSHNVSIFNGGSGVTVVSGVVSNNTANNNAGDGIEVILFGTVNNNTAATNGNFGLNLNFKAGYTGNVMTDNDSGEVNGGASLGGGNHNLCNFVPC